MGVCCADVRESGADGDAVWDCECGERVGEAGGLSGDVWGFEGVLQPKEGVVVSLLHFCLLICANGGIESSGTSRFVMSARRRVSGLSGMF